MFQVKYCFGQLIFLGKFLSSILIFGRVGCVGTRDGWLEVLRIRLTQSKFWIEFELIGTEHSNILQEVQCSSKACSPLVFS